MSPLHQPCNACHFPPAEPLHQPELDPRAPDCANCHDFGSSEFSGTDCLGCHDGRNADISTVSFHFDVGCQACHDPHKLQFKLPSCLNCHHEQNTSHGKQDHRQPSTCLTCHSAHGPATDAVTSCAPCHVDRPERIGSAALSAGHKTCTACHAPHPDRRADNRQTSSRVGCGTCHRISVIRGRGSSPDHRTCTACHVPHKPKTDPELRCRTCHAEIESDHQIEELKPCTSCHPAHPRRTEKGLAGCTTCHKTSGAVFHDKSLTCADCHRPHRFSIAAREEAECGRCHAESLQATVSVEGHRPCTVCHTNAAHSPTNSPPNACRNCHDLQHDAAPYGHRQCETCHEPHAGALKKATSDCATCHRAEQASAHGRIPEGCATCHGAHPAKRPDRRSCQGCHPRRRGLHTIAYHRRCTDCHDAHGFMDSGSRETCIACHETLTQHEPNADHCQGCHPFR